jgi:hypothetical protein
MSPQAGQVGSGFFYVMALGHDMQRPRRPNGAWSFNMASASLRDGDGDRDCEDTRADH